MLYFIILVGKDVIYMMAISSSDLLNEFTIYAINKLINEKSQSIIVYKNSKFKFIDIMKISDKQQKIDKKILKQLEKMTK